MPDLGDEGREGCSGSQGFGAGTGFRQNMDQDRVGGAMEGSRIDFGFDTAPHQDDAMIKACQTRRQFIDVTADCGGDCGPGEAQFT